MQAVKQPPLEVVIHLPSIRDVLKRGARSLLLAVALLYLITMWEAESIYNQQTAFRIGCITAGGFITFSDNTTSCTRIRSTGGGMLQL